MRRPARDVTAVRPHLRNCPACRARVRALRESSLGLAAVLPVPVALERADPAGAVTRLLETLTTTVHDRVALSAAKLQAGVEAALPGKLAVVAASAAAIAGGGVAVERATEPAPTAGLRRVAQRVGTGPPPAAEPRPTAATAPAPPPRRAVARRTTRAEFGLTDAHAASAAAADSTAAREFAASPAPAATASSASTAPAAPAPAPRTRAERTAAAEFGGG